MNTAPVPESPSNSGRRSDLRKLLTILVLAFAPIVIYDTIAPREREISTQGAIAAIRLYQRTLSPRMPISCKFKPTCSRYGLRSIEKHGFVVGSAKTAWRIMRCNPFTKMGTIDEP